MPSTKEQIQELLREGLSQNAIADRVKCTRQYVSLVARRGDRSDSPYYQTGLKVKRIVTQRDPDFYRKIGRRGGQRTAAKNREEAA